MVSEANLAVSANRGHAAMPAVMRALRVITGKNVHPAATVVTWMILIDATRARHVFTALLDFLNMYYLQQVITVSFGENLEK